MALQIESIDDPVPSVEAILRRCNKKQVSPIFERIKSSFRLATQIEHALKFKSRILNLCILQLLFNFSRLPH